MNIHEHQAYEVFRKYGIKTASYVVIEDPSQAEQALSNISIEAGAVVKVQVHAGGRGKAGGVILAKSKEEILAAIHKLIGFKIVTKQTGSEGIISHKVLVAPLTSIVKEYYVGIIVDRSKACPTLICSSEGGMDIEEIAEKMPEKILKVPFGSDGILKPFQIRKIAEFLSWDKNMLSSAAPQIKGLCKAFVDVDASLMEINPFVLTESGEMMAIDGKVSFDDNALYRQKEYDAYFDPSQVSANEVLAKEHDLAYIALEGSVGCMVNGAGLAMATMDLIQHHGLKPANFLDVGGGASKEKVAAGFSIILKDPKVQAILVNIFGGIMDCAVLAEGIIAAAKELQVKVPLVVRMEGTNVDLGKAALEKSDLAIISANSLTDAAEKVVQAVKN